MLTYPCHVNSAIGNEKKMCNEDSIDFFSLDDIFFVCISDGQGSKSPNERAGKIAISEFQRYMKISRPSFDLLPSEINKAFYLVQRVFSMFRGYESESLSSLACGMTVVAIASNRLGYVAHFGNARASIIRDGNWHSLTEDHTLAYEAYKRGDISEADIALNENRGILTRYFGQPNDQPLCTLMKINFNVDDIVVLSTDGVHFYVTNEEVQLVIANVDGLEAITNEIQQLASEKGSRDDRTVGIIVVR